MQASRFKFTILAILVSVVLGTHLNEAYRQSGYGSYPGGMNRWNGQGINPYGNRWNRGRWDQGYNQYGGGCNYFGGGGGGSYGGSNYGGGCRNNGANYGGGYGQYGGAGAYGGYGGMGNPNYYGGYGGAGYGASGYGGGGMNSYGSGGYGASGNNFPSGYYGGQGGFGSYGRGTYGSGYGSLGFLDSQDGLQLSSGWDGYTASASGSTSTSLEQAGSASTLGSAVNPEADSFDRSTDGARGSANSQAWSERFAAETPNNSIHSFPQGVGQPSSVTYASGPNEQQQQQHQQANAAALHGGQRLNMNHSYNQMLSTGDLATGDAGLTGAHRSSGQAGTGNAQLNARHSTPNVPTSTTTPAPEYVMITPSSRRAIPNDE